MNIGDLVQLSFKGKMALGVGTQKQMTGIITSFVSSFHVSVKWFAGLESDKLNMHIDFIELLGDRYENT